MPNRKYFIEYNEPARLEIKWDGGRFRLKENFLILYDGQPLGAFEKRSELEQGQEIQLPDSSVLKVTLISNNFNILHNGKSIHYINDAKRTPIAALCMAVFLLVLGLSTYVFKVKAESWSIRFYDDPVFCAEMASPLYVDLVGGAAIAFAFVFIVTGLYARRNYLIGYMGLDFLILLGAVIFSLFLPYQLGVNINGRNILLVVLLLFSFGIKLYGLKKQRAR